MTWGLLPPFSVTRHVPWIVLENTVLEGEISFNIRIFHYRKLVSLLNWFPTYSNRIKPKLDCSTDAEKPFQIHKEDGFWKRVRVSAWACFAPSDYWQGFWTWLPKPPSNLFGFVIHSPFISVWSSDESYNYICVDTHAHIHMQEDIPGWVSWGGGSMEPKLHMSLLQSCS